MILIVWEVIFLCGKTHNRRFRGVFRGPNKSSITVDYYSFVKKPAEHLKNYQNPSVLVHILAYSTLYTKDKKSKTSLDTVPLTYSLPYMYVPGPLLRPVPFFIPFFGKFSTCFQDQIFCCCNEYSFVTNIRFQ
jgi:hypothetical protein